MLLNFLLLFLIGWLYLLIVDFRGEIVEKLGLSYIIGSSIITIIYFLVLGQGVKATPNTLRNVLFFTLVFFLAFSFLIFKIWKRNFLKTFTLKRKGMALSFNKKNKTDWIMLISWVCIFCLFLITLIYALYTPVYTTDSITLYDFRAKIILETQKLMPISNLNKWYFQPLYTTMMNLFVRLSGYSNPTFVYPTLYFSFALVFYSVLRRWMGRALSSLGTLLMYSTPITLWESKLDGLTNMPYLVFYCSAIFYLYFVFCENRKGQIGFIFVSSLLLGSASWVRITEPFWIFPLVLVVAMVLKRSSFLLIAYLGQFFFIKQIWPSFVKENYFISVSKATSSLLKNVDASKTTGFFELFSKVTNFVSEGIFSALNPVIYLFLPLAVIQTFKGNNKVQLYYLSAIIFILATIMGGSMFYSLKFDYWQSLGDSLFRMAGIFSPLMWMYIANSSLWKDFSVFKSKSK